MYLSRLRINANVLHDAKVTLVDLLCKVYHGDKITLVVHGRAGRMERSKESPDLCRQKNPLGVGPGHMFEFRLGKIHLIQ